MSRLANTNTNHFLTKYGFTYGPHSGPQGESGYTNTFNHEHDTECLWVTVDLNANVVHFYNEFECGGLLSQYSIDIPENIDTDDETEFIEWLDEYIPDED